MSIDCFNDYRCHCGAHGSYHETSGKFACVAHKSATAAKISQFIVSRYVARDGTMHYEVIDRAARGKARKKLVTTVEADARALTVELNS